MKHIEITCNSLAECYAKLRQSDLLNLSDLGHRTKVTIDIDTSSPFDGSFIRIPDNTEKVENIKEKEMKSENAARQHIDNIIPIGYDKVDVYEAFIAGAKWQKEQKPAEWSEEDKKIIGRLRSIVNECAFHNDALDVNGDYCEGDYGELDNWLKSLRPQPHWKPSEEQMEVDLEKEAEAYWKAQGGGSHAQWDKFRAVVKHFTEWQKEQLLKDSVEGKVIAGKDGSQYIQTICVDIKESLPNKVKLKIIKDDERI